MAIEPRKNLEFAPWTPRQFYACGCCGGMHHIDRPGYIDCRDDASRFTLTELDERFGEDGWEEIEDPLVVEAETSD